MSAGDFLPRGFFLFPIQSPLPQSVSQVPVLLPYLRFAEGGNQDLPFFRRAAGFVIYMEQFFPSGENDKKMGP